MNFLIALLIVVEVITCLMLIGLVLLQKSKSEGLGMAFGAGAGESLFGARAGNVLSKATVILGVVFMANTLALGVLFAKKEATVMDKVDTPPAAQPAVQSVPLDPVDLVDSAIVPTDSGETTIAVEPVAEPEAGM